MNADKKSKKISKIRAWAVYVIENGKERQDGIIRTPDAEDRAHKKVKEYLDQGIQARCAEYNGPTVRFDV